MNELKVKFTWHYYVMATGVLLAMLAATLGAMGGIASGGALAVISHPHIPFKTPTRLFFMIVFCILYVFAFPNPEVVIEMMAQEFEPRR